MNFLAMIPHLLCWLVTRQERRYGQYMISLHPSLFHHVFWCAVVTRHVRAKDSPMAPQSTSLLTVNMLKVLTWYEVNTNYLFSPIPFLQTPISRNLISLKANHSSSSENSHAKPPTPNPNNPPPRPRPARLRNRNPTPLPPSSRPIPPPIPNPPVLAPPRQVIRPILHLLHRRPVSQD